MKEIITYFGYAAIAAGFVSAVLWIRASQFPAVYPIGYLSGPPKHIEDIVRNQSRLNAWAAITTGISVLLQAIAALLQRLAS